MTEEFKMSVQDKEYTIKMNSHQLTDNSWYVSVKEDGWKYVTNSLILEEIWERIENVYGGVGYITGRD